YNTLIYKQGAGVVLKEPSLIAMSSNIKDKEVKAVGSDAHNLLTRTPKNITVYSPISKGVIHYEELVVLMLKEFLKKVFPVKTFGQKIKAILCVPLGITQDEKKQFEIACYKSEITEVYIVPEVFTYAIGNKIDIKSKTSQFFVNIGADTTSISIISNYTILSGYNISIGGSIINSGIVRFIENNYLIKISQEQAEELKIEIGSLFENYDAKMTIVGINTLTNNKEELVVRASDIYPVTSYYFSKIAEAIKSIIASCKPEIVSDITRFGINYYGGSIEIAGFEQFMNSKTGIKVKFIERPKHEIFGVKNLINNTERLRKILKNN
ncbi:MAG: rod shape-determining protein, partial [Clostridia bacterium]|nr:rod shape-determining protein [Clostridia bacterium]